MKIIVTIIATYLVINSILLAFLSFLRNQKQESNFQKVGWLVTRNVYAFCLKRVELYFKATLNSIGFYMDFSYGIPVSSLGPCYELSSWVTSSEVKVTNENI